MSEDKFISGRIASEFSQKEWLDILKQINMNLSTQRETSGQQVKALEEAFKEMKNNNNFAPFADKILGVKVENTERGEEKHNANQVFQSVVSFGLFVIVALILCLQYLKYRMKKNARVIGLDDRTSDV